MKKISILMLVTVSAMAFSFASCNKGKFSKYKTDVDSVSYILGSSIGKNFQSIPGGKVNLDALIAGLKAAYNKDSLDIKMSDMEAQMYLQSYFMKASQQEAKKNEAQSQKFLNDNKKKSGVQTTASGLQYKIEKQGNGPKPKATDKVKVNYVGKLIDGTTFDSSYDRKQPAEFIVNQVIPGWTEGLQLMPVGSKFSFYIPANLAYGERGAGDKIKPGSALVFEVELLSIEPAQAAASKTPAPAKK